MISWPFVVRKLDVDVSSTNDDDNDVVYMFFLFYSLLYCFLFSLSLTHTKSMLGSPSLITSIHGDLGCQDLANKKSTSTIQLLEDLSWMTPVRETCKMKVLYYNLF